MMGFVFGLFSLMVFFLQPSFVSVYAASSNNVPIVGGPCSYVGFSGKCKITGVDSSAVTFRFTPRLFSLLSKSTLTLGIKETIQHMTKYNVGIEHFSYLGLGLNCLKNEAGEVRYPITETDIKRCGLKIGANFNCKMTVITRGTCAPVNYVFSD